MTFSTCIMARTVEVGVCETASWCLISGFNSAARSGTSNEFDRLQGRRGLLGKPIHTIWASWLSPYHSFSVHLGSVFGVFVCFIFIINL
jgi:hypothetical protein